MAQIQVSAQTERTNFLLYERVDLLVNISNIGDTDLVLNNEENHSWLSFLVSRHSSKIDYPARPERDSNFRPLTLKAGESKALRINLTPLFSFREEGEYKASAVIDLPGQGQIISQPVPFTVLKGRQVWSQVRPVDGIQRTYSLIRFSPKPDITALYLRVEAPDENIVYANISLGEVVASVDPEVLFDPKGNVHVLQPVALSTYLYTRADSDGKILDQRIFKSAGMRDATGIQNVPPRLAKLNDGNVFVSGGMAENPNTPRERLSDAQGIKKPTAPETSAQ